MAGAGWGRLAAPVPPDGGRSHRLGWARLAAVDGDERPVPAGPPLVLGPPIRPAPAAGAWASLATAAVADEADVALAVPLLDIAAPLVPVLGIAAPTVPLAPGPARRVVRQAVATLRARLRPLTARMMRASLEEVGTAASDGDSDVFAPSEPPPDALAEPAASDGDIDVFVLAEPPPDALAEPPPAVAEPPPGLLAEIIPHDAGDWAVPPGGPDLVGMREVGTVVMNFVREITPAGGHVPKNRKSVRVVMDSQLRDTPLTLGSAISTAKRLKVPPQHVARSTSALAIGTFLVLLYIYICIYK